MYNTLSDVIIHSCSNFMTEGEAKQMKCVLMFITGKKIGLFLVNNNNNNNNNSNLFSFIFTISTLGDVYLC